jgi:chromate transporter
LRVLVVSLVLWWLPVLAVGLWLGWKSVAVSLGLFFSKAALITFGGAYAVLSYVAEHAVNQQDWLSASDMVTGLGLAESTPGPLIMVLQFVGFVAGWNNPGGLPPLASAAVGALITTWVTFVPCFLFIFLGGPYVERIGETPRLGAALAAITAAVVGVILNLAVVFAVHTLWKPEFDLFVLLCAPVAFVALRRFGVPVVLAGCALASLLWWLVLGGV